VRAVTVPEPACLYDDPMRFAHGAFLALTGLAACASVHAQETQHDWALELSFDALSDDAGDKLAADSGDGSFRVALLYTGEITPTLTIDAAADAVNDGTSGIDVTEAFLRWRPVPRSRIRHELRSGVFYPPLSLENTRRGWSSPYAASFSALNTWVGEELRAVGTEWSVSRSLGSPQRQRELGFVAAAYYANDPAGALLAWRGWALHHRQTRLDDALLLPSVPQIQPGMMFDMQAPATEPFVETDHAPGFYYGAHLKLGRRATVAALHYDNHSDPTSLKNGHYGWTTRFDHIGLQLELPAGLGLIVQWLDGSTVMGPVMSPPAAPGYHVVDNDFDAAFVLLTRKQGAQRWSLRVDSFSVDDNDRIPLDDNSESGDAITLAWRYEPDASWLVGAEWQTLDVDRPAFAYFGRPVSKNTNLARIEARYTLNRRP